MSRAGTVRRVGAVLGVVALLAGTTGTAGAGAVPETRSVPEVPAISDLRTVSAVQGASAATNAVAMDAVAPERPEKLPEEPAPDEEDADSGPQAGPGQWYVEPYGLQKAWETTTGAGVTVAVIDSGIDDDHDDLRGTVTGAKDFSGVGTDGTTPVGPDATIHHGTAVAGVIAGQGEGVAPTGVAPDADLLSASMWLGSGLPEGAVSSRTQAAQALRWAVDSGADVVNMSLGWSDPAWSSDWDEAFAHAHENDVVVIACVGNRSQGATRAWAPSTVPGVVGVGGLSTDGTVYQPGSAPGTAVDLMGPAQDIPVPWYEGGVANAEGCSFAAPFVAGVAALVRSDRPDLSADQVVALLESTAKPVQGHTHTPHPGDPQAPDPIVGHGRVDPVAALDAEVPASVPSAATELQDWIRMHRRADPQAATAGGGSTGEDGTADVAGTPGPTDGATSSSGADGSAGESGGQGASAGAQTGEVGPGESAEVEPAGVNPLGPVLLVGSGLVALGLLGGAVVPVVRRKRGVRSGGTEVVKTFTRSRPRG